MDDLQTSVLLHEAATAIRKNVELVVINKQNIEHLTQDVMTLLNLVTEQQRVIEQMSTSILKLSQAVLPKG